MIGNESVRKYRRVALLAVAGLLAASCHQAPQTTSLSGKTPMPSAVPQRLTAADLAALRDPNRTLDPANPYLKMTGHFVNRARPIVAKSMADPQGKAEGSEVFWLVWDTVAPQGAHRTDAARRAEALAALDRWTRQLEAKPSGYWDILAALEAVNLVVRNGQDSAMANEMIERLRPSIAGNYRGNEEQKEWPSWTPNTLFQSTAILTLAANLFEGARPDDADPAKWRAMAKECLRRALPHQLPGGAFSYIQDSGPDPVYYNFDATFLGRYWQLSGDPAALKALQRMAGQSRSATRCGMLDAVASPWWKHVWGSGGPYHGPEITATLSCDPLTKGVATLRQAVGQPYYFTYYAMLFWDPRGSAQGVTDRCEFDLNANGPALRAGGFDVVLPGRPWTDTTFGASIAAATGFDAILTAARLALYAPGEGDPLGGNSTFSMTYTDDVPRHASVVGTDWIAAAWSFVPHRATCGDRESAKPGPAQRTDLWFADTTGAAGVVSLEVTAETAAVEPLGWLRFSAPPQATADGKGFTVGPLHAEIGGPATKIEALPAGAKPGPGMIRLQMAAPGAKAWHLGDRFHYTLSTWPEGGRRWQVTASQLTGDLVSVTLSNATGDQVLLLYNRGPKAVRYDLPADAPVAGGLSAAPGRPSTVVLGSQRSVRLPANALLALRSRVPPPAL